MSNFFKDLKLVGKATQTIEALKQQCEEVTEENELLLQQLHQVQEELEHYFLKYQDIKRENEATQKCLDNILADHPNYFSYDHIECEPVRNQADRLHWTISGLLGAGRYWETCEFDTIVEKDIAGFVFSKDGEGASPLAVWPKSYEHKSEITCIPTGTQDNVQQRAELLKALSSSDWRLVTLLPDVLTKAINHKKATVPKATQLISTLNKTHDILLKHIPTKLRFDKVDLTRALVHPGYEHLAFRISNLSYGELVHSEFEFRLGCANITEHQFGTDPKLEFPLVNGKPQLQSWYAESEDEFGSKLEIRFATPGAMDLDVWNKLQVTDQHLVMNLIHKLPDLISSVHGEYQKPGRQLREWASMAEGLQKTLKSLLIFSEKD